tara:strand:- start:112 stop:615 length:504 start_codon:yes stop_codon:yes gene_type:complete
MKVKEEHDIIIEKHPYFQSLNKKLLKDVNDIGYPLSYQTNVKAKHSDWKISTPTVDLVTEWIMNLLKIKYPWIDQREHKIFVEHAWFAEYSKNEFTVIHDHAPYVWSYVYFIQCPKGSSPLIFNTSGKRIKAEEGKVVIFPANVYHSVPPNKCDNRIVMAGNLHINI